MGRLDDRLLNHPLRQQLEAVRTQLAGLSEDAIAAADEYAEGVVDRVDEALRYIEAVLGAANPALVPASALSGIESALTKAASTASQLPSNPQMAQLLDQHIESAVSAAAPLVAVSKLVLDRAGMTAEAFDDALTASVKDLAGRTSSLAAELDALEERRAAAATELENDVRARLEAFEQSIASMQASLDAEKARVDQLITDQQAQFEAAHRQQQDAFDSLREELRQEAAGTLAEFKDKAEATAERLDAEAEKVLEDVQARRADVERLYGVITDTSTTGAFRDEAKAQKEAADKWRWVAVGFGVISALVAILAIVLAFVAPDKATTTSAITAKVTATLVAAGLAAYAGRQSGRHREREEEAKRLELELAAFPPFIDSLDESQKRDVRKAFADRAFRGRPEQAPHRALFRKDDSFGVAVPDLVQLVLEAARKTNGAAS